MHKLQLTFRISIPVITLLWFLKSNYAADLH